MKVQVNGRWISKTLTHCWPSFTDLLPSFTDLQLIPPSILTPDVVKTRMQKQVIREGTKPKYNGLLQSCILIAKEEGTPALWKGITPRLLRIMPGQAITFMTYEFVSKKLNRYGLFVVDPSD